MLTKKQLEQLYGSAMHSQADFAEIFEEEATDEVLSMLNDEVEEINSVKRAGVGIRLYKDVQSVYGYSNETDMDSLTALVEDLRQAIGTEEKEENITLKEETIENRHPVQIDPIEASLETKVDLLKRANQTALQTDERIVKCQSRLLSFRQHVQISNSEGKLVQDTRIRTRLACSAYASEDGKMQSGFYGPGAASGLEFFEEVTPEDIAKESARIALVMLDAVDCPSGKMPVIIDNGFGGVIFHEACGHSLEATAVAKNQSVFAGKQGQQIANRCVSAVDDGTIANAWGSQNIDDEGNPQQRRVLIEKGILKQYMVDRLNGRRMHTDSTGSGRRQSYKFEPTSRMSNTYIEAGTDSFDSLFEGIEKGLYAKNMGGGSVNPQTGEFNFAVNEGYLIENGKITVPVKGASLIGTGAEILMNIEKVSDNLKRG
ncbi:MAG: TldD/PmbA family protein, partial [Erysipelotrichaceae bacterium]|nr:TldD/PmbA family protein [Erysipelotrichaceae bacterium]